MRQTSQTLKQQAHEIRNRLAAAKAEALELRNFGEKQRASAAAA
jgi:hypothetical protein